MTEQIALEAIYAPSEDIVAREIEGEIIIVPITTGLADLEEELFTLNETGREVWRALDGRRTLADVVDLLSRRFEAGPAEIERDVRGLVAELVRRRMLVERSAGSAAS